MQKITAKELYEKLKQDGIINSKGKIIFELNNVVVKIATKDSIGSMLQNWIQCWASKKNLYLRVNPSTQEFPDYFLSETDNSDFLEIKAFDYSASPNFDIANFDTYVRSLLIKPSKLDADYLIFGYILDGDEILIKDIWLKKVWELCTNSEDWELKLQVKQNVIYNIRPVNFTSCRENIAKPFKNKDAFLDAIQKVLNKYNKTAGKYTNWLAEVKKKINKS